MTDSSLTALTKLLETFEATSDQHLPNFSEIKATAILQAIRNRKIPGVYATGAQRVRRLTRDQIIDIYLSSEKQAYLAWKYNVSPGYVSNIKSGRLCKAITKDLPR